MEAVDASAARELEFGNDAFLNTRNAILPTKIASNSQNTPTSSWCWSLLRHIPVRTFSNLLFIPGLRCARVLQQTKAAIHEIDHTRIDNAVEDIAPLAPRLNDSTIRKALELVAHGLRLHAKLRC
jgi:hypothetical protein